MHGGKGGAGGWIMWGLTLTLPMMAMGGLTGFILCWLFFGSLAFCSEKRYHQSGSYIRNEIEKGTYVGDKKGRVVTIDDFPELKNAIDIENYSKELVKEVAIRNAIENLPCDKKSNSTCKLATIRSVLPYDHSGVDEYGVYREVTRTATQEEIEEMLPKYSEDWLRRIPSLRKSLEIDKELFKKVWTKIYY